MGAARRVRRPLGGRVPTNTPTFPHTRAPFRRSSNTVALSPAPMHRLGNTCDVDSLHGSAAAALGGEAAMAGGEMPTKCPLGFEPDTPSQKSIRSQILTSVQACGHRLVHNQTTRHTHTHTQTREGKHSPVNKRNHTHSRTYSHTGATHTQTHTHTHVHTHTCTRTHTYVHMHARTHAHLRQQTPR